MNNLNELSKTVFKANFDKGFWTETINLPFEMKQCKLFSEEQIESVKKAMTAQKLALIHSEVSEALEANRGRTNTLNREEFQKIYDTECQTESAELNKLKFKEAFESCIKNSEEDEIADIIIRCLDYCGGFNIDIDWHIEQKLKYNSLRAYKHDKNY